MGELLTSYRSAIIAQAAQGSAITAAADMYWCCYPDYHPAFGTIQEGKVIDTVSTHIGGD
jgi:hypothetical protein